MSDSNKNRNIYFLKKKTDSHHFLSLKQKIPGRGDSVIFSRFLYIYIF